jgi:RHS repeat-associated protein
VRSSRPRGTGAPTSSGAPQGSATYTTEQWNGGDELASFGLSILGARLYDPVIGRFLSRDPLHIARTATTTNPYAFAANDPVNLSDPSGLDWQDGCIGIECRGLDWIGVFGFGGSGGAGVAHGSNGGNEVRGSYTPPPTRPPMTGKTAGPCQYSDGTGGCSDAMWPTFTETHWYGRAWDATGRGLRAVGHGYVWTMQHVQRAAEVALDFVDANAQAIEDGVVAGFMGAAEPEMLLSDLYTAGVTALGSLFGADEPEVIDGAPTVIEDDAALVDELPGDTPVCRGGTCTAERFEHGSGVTLDKNGRLQGVSVNSKAGHTLEELTSTIPNKQVGVSTVDEVRKAGGNVFASPTDNNPFHATMSGITPDQAQQLFTPTIRNPNIP